MKLGSEVISEFMNLDLCWHTRQDIIIASLKWWLLHLLIAVRKSKVTSQEHWIYDAQTSGSQQVA